MTRIVLILTAVPLAAILALVLDTLLDRRLAAVKCVTRRPAGAGGRRALSIALAVALGLAAAPLLAADAEPSCHAIDCSLVVDAARVDELWKPAPGDRVVVVAQSGIPVAFDVALDRWDEPEDEVASEEEQPRRQPDTVPEAPAK